MENKLINIVYITDEGYAMPTCVSIVSLIEHKLDNEIYNINIIANSLEEHSKEILLSLKRENVDINIIDTNDDGYTEMEKNCTTPNTHVTISSLHKFEIPEVLSELNKVLYLDSDIIINKNISELYDVDLLDNYAGVIKEMGDKELENGESFLGKEIGLEDNNYFNAGVMLLNLEAMRRDNTFQQLVNYKMNNATKFVDQDAHNIIFQKKKVMLPFKYNFRSCIFEEITLEEYNLKYCGEKEKYKNIEDVFNDQVIIHMTSKYKPWDYNLSWTTDIYMKYYNISPYKDKKISLKPLLKLMIDSYVQQIADLKMGYKSYKLYYEFLLELLNKKVNGIQLYDYFIKNNYKNIGMYGFGSIGKMVYDEIRQTTQIKMSSIIEGRSRVVEYKSEILNVYSMKGFDYNEIEVVIVTPFYEFEKIKKDLLEAGCNIPIISIEDLIAD